MGELNYPADEQFRKESQITKNRLERDKNMKRKKKMIDIKDSVRNKLNYVLRKEFYNMQI